MDKVRSIRSAVFAVDDNPSDGNKEGYHNFENKIKYSSSNSKLDSLPKFENKFKYGSNLKLDALPSDVPLRWDTYADVAPKWGKVFSAGAYNRNENYHHHMPFSGEAYPSPEDIWTPGTAVATPHGTMSLRLKNQIKIDMTLDRAIRVINKGNNIVLAINSFGSSSAFLHPHGRVLQTGSKVEMLIYDAICQNNKMAKMWHKGVSFTSSKSGLVYLVDPAGTRSTTDSFRDLSIDFSLSIFYEEAKHGPYLMHEAVSTLQKASYWKSDEGIDNWVINDVSITQSTDGIIQITRNGVKYEMKTGNNSNASLSTPFVHCTASGSHMFVRRGDRRMHFDGVNFIVRNAGHSAGFDELNNLKVF